MTSETRCKRLVPTVRCLTENQWPEADRLAWTAARRRGSLLDDGGGATGWAASTQATVASGYGRWLTFLVSHGLLDPTVPPAERVTKERIEAYLADLRAQGNASGTIHIRILQLCLMLEVMTPGSCPGWLHHILRRLRAAVQPTRDDRARLVPAKQLLKLALSLMDRAEASSSPSARLRAVMYRDGLMLAVLLVIALRVGNLAALELGVSFVRKGPQWWVVFPARKVKSRKSINWPVHGLTSRIDRYLSFWRPVLLRRPAEQIASGSRDTGYLWLGRYGGRFGSKKVNKRINDVTRRELGRALNPHLFRKLQPTELAIRDPAHVGIAQVLLSHGSNRTTEKAYNLAQTAAAGRKVQAQLVALRGPGPRKKKA